MISRHLDFSAQELLEEVFVGLFLRASGNLERCAEEKPDDGADRTGKENHESLRHLEGPNDEFDFHDRRILQCEHEDEQKKQASDDKFDLGGHGFLLSTFSLEVTSRTSSISCASAAALATWSEPRLCMGNIVWLV